jgi:hypothetical protein
MEESYDKSWITWFNIHKSRNLYEEVLSDKFLEYKKCRCCNESIYYYDSTFSVDKNKNINPINKSFLSKKELLGNVYYLSVCEDCLSKKYPKYQSLNKGRVFNRICDITCYAFNIPDDVAKKWNKENYAITQKHLIKKYGEEVGKNKWKEYCDKQALTNTFEYKKEKYNWTKEQFDEYNKSRGITLDNLIKKHGIDKGTDMWDKYIKSQIMTKSKDYVVEKYGEDYWIQLNNSKKLNLENFIRKYGQEFGLSKYNEYLDKITQYKPSKMSQTFFEKLDKYFEGYTTYYYNKNKKEFGKLLSNGKYIFIDYFILELNLAIEYNGDIWHANPLYFKENDKPYPFFNKKLTAKEIWNNEKERLECLKKDFNIDTIVVWESDDINYENLYKNIIEKYGK